MKAILLSLLLLVGIPAFAQIKGSVSDKNGTPVPFAGIQVEGSQINTSANEEGNYSLNITSKGQYTIIYQSLGFKSKAITIEVSSLPYTLNVTLEEEKFDLKEVVISSEDPAVSIIKNAIASRTKNAEKITGFKADFYSKGTFRLKNVPKKILGQKVGNLGASLDSSGNGILYLSETVSRIKYLYPDKIHEHVVASKVSGNDNGMSYNNAEAAEFNFYKNYLPFEVNALSPIADNALNHYLYKLESTFTAANGQQVNKIKVIPKREKEPVFSGYIYITDNSWELYAVDVSIKGSQIRRDLVNRLNIKQNFAYRSKDKLWIKTSQTLDFDASLFGVVGFGRFASVYSDFLINPEFDKHDFTAEVQYFEDDANKKTDAFWSKNRPLPLTKSEAADYKRKDSLQEITGSKAHMDALDRQRNRFKWLSTPIGYVYYNTDKNWQISYTGILRRLGFNSVQAYNLAPGFYFTKHNPEKQTYTTIGTDLNYGFAEQRFRATGTISRKFNNFSKRIITLKGGSSIEQYNPENPINRIVNSVSTLFFRNNYMKLYDNSFLRLSYEEEVINGLYVYGNFEYTRKHWLQNTTNFSTLKDAYKPYTSNNPLLLYDEATKYDNAIPTFDKHNMLKASLATHISFGQKYRTRPDGRETITNDKYPRLFLKYEKGFAASIKDYNFDHLSAKVNYDLTLGNKGELGMSLRGGKFFNSDNIAFTDYKHFNGNQTHVGKSERYLNVFNFLPYYSHSTNDQYFEGHIEHNFKGFLTNSIPLFNKLNYHLVAGYHILAVPKKNPYSEFTVGLDNVGWGKARFFRIDYIRSYESGFINDGVIFGLTFLDIFE